MNKKPVSYLQTDTRWKAVRLKCNGGTMSLGGGGCGPTSAAMLVETLTRKTCLPTEAFKWACDHGYVYANQGTAYACFKPLFAAYGIECGMIDAQCLSAKSPVREQVIRKLKEGYYLIALMKKGLWTNGGHYIVVWWADDKIRINDPASTKDARLNGDPDTFFSQAKYFWWVDARKHNGTMKPAATTEKGEDEDMTGADILAKLTDEQAWQLVEKANRHAATLKPSEYAEAACKKGIASGLFTDGNQDGLVDNPQSYMKRQELATVLDRKGLLN